MFKKKQKNDPSEQSHCKSIVPGSQTHRLKTVFMALSNLRKLSWWLSPFDLASVIKSTAWNFRIGRGTVHWLSIFGPNVKSCLVGKLMPAESAAEKQNCLTATANQLSLLSKEFIYTSHVMSFWMGKTVTKTNQHGIFTGQNQKYNCYSWASRFC